MRMMTRSGNNNNTANETDTFEFPFNRIRLLKKFNLGNIRSFCLPKLSSRGACDEGIRLASPWNNPMGAAYASTGCPANEKFFQPTALELLLLRTTGQTGQDYSRTKCRETNAMCMMPRIRGPVLRIIGACGVYIKSAGSMNAGC